LILRDLYAFKTISIKSLKMKYKVIKLPSFETQFWITTYKLDNLQVFHSLPSDHHHSLYNKLIALVTDVVVRTKMILG